MVEFDIMPRFIFRATETAQQIRDTVTLPSDDQVVAVAQLNYPIAMPVNVTHRLTFIARHGLFIRFESDKLTPCSQTEASVLTAVLTDIYKPDTRVELCSGQPSNATFHYASLFHSLTLTYTQLRRSPSIILGHVRALSGK